jgi:hypothetical protein
MIDTRTFTANEMATSVAKAVEARAEQTPQGLGAVIAGHGIDLIGDGDEFEIRTEGGQRFVVSVRLDESEAR